MRQEHEPLSAVASYDYHVRVLGNCASGFEPDAPDGCPGNEDFSPVVSKLNREPNPYPTNHSCPQSRGKTRQRLAHRSYAPRRWLTT
jgi:hypothetical protein